MNIFRKKTLLKKELKNWLLFKKNTIKMSTYYRYKYIINKYIIQYFKGKSIYFFEKYDFNEYVQHLSKTLSPKSISDIIIILKSILRHIEKQYHVEYDLDLISVPKKKKQEIQILKRSEIEKLEEFCMDGFNPKYIGIVVCLYTGLRIGEICALKWKDINLDEKLITVNKTIQRIYKGKNDTQVQVDDPKTYHSIRKIPISNRLIDILQHLKQKDNFADNTYFLTGTKKTIEPRYYYKLFKDSLKLCNIKDYSFHTLRHTFATNCIRVGMDAKSLSEILGHSNVNITLNRYVHSSYNTQKDFLDKL